jgi:hypothetical protein
MRGTIRIRWSPTALDISGTRRHNRIPPAALEIRRLQNTISRTLPSQYQVRSSRAIQRHWILVYCAFTFCWWQAAQQKSDNTSDLALIGDTVLRPNTPMRHSPSTPRARKKSLAAAKLPLALSWPRALRLVRSWLEPAIMLRRYWHAYSPSPPPFALHLLLAWLWCGNGINVYTSA